MKHHANFKECAENGGLENGDQTVKNSGGEKWRTM